MESKGISNLISSNIAIVVNMIVSVLATRIIIFQLGLDEYGKLGLVLSITNIMSSIGNAITGAIARYYTMYITKDSHKVEQIISSSIITNTALFLVFIVICPIFTSNAPFTILVLLSIYFNQIAGVLNSSNFYYKRFVETSVINSVNRIIYLVILYFLLSFFFKSIYAIAIALIVSSLYKFISFYFSFHSKNKGMRLLCSTPFETHIELISFTGWMLLSYLGMYVIQSGMFIVVEHNSPEQLGIYSVLNQIYTVVVQIIGTVTVISSPYIYRYISEKKYKEAKRFANLFFYDAFLIAFVGFVLNALIGPKVFTLWLGSEIAAELTKYTNSIILAAFASSLCVPTSVYLAGVNKVKEYGIYTLIESGVVIGSTTILMRYFGLTNFNIVFIIIAIFYFIKVFLALPIMMKYKILEFSDFKNRISLSTLIFIVVGVIIAIFFRGFPIISTTVFLLCSIAFYLQNKNSIMPNN